MWMSKILAWLGGAFSSIMYEYFVWIKARTIKKVAIALSLAATIISAFIAIYASLTALFLAAIVIMPPELSDILRFLLPGNTYSCLSMIFTSHITIIGYKFFTDKLKSVAKIFLMVS